MAATVVTSENLAEFVSTGKVPEFKPPGAEASPESKPDDKTNGQANGQKGDIKAGNGTDPAAKTDNTGQARDASGKFVPADKADATSADDPEDTDLPERVRKQIGKKHRQMKEAEEFAETEGRRAIAAERRAEALERELAELRGGKAADNPQSKSTAKAFDKPKPDKKDFTTVGDYADALVEWRVEKAAHEARQKADELRAEEESQRPQKEAARELAKGFAQRQEEFQKTCPDYEAVLEDCDEDLHNAGLQYLVESDVGPQLAYWLAKPENQHHIKRINKLTPARMAGELGKLESQLESAPQQQQSQQPGQKPAAAPAVAPRKVSSAPAPIEPLNSDSSATAGHKDPATMSFKELREYRRQEALRGRRS